MDCGGGRSETVTGCCATTRLIACFWCDASIASVASDAVLSGASTVVSLVPMKVGVESVAHRAVVELVDDIDGTVFGDEGESINYAVDGVEYEIDLKTEHAKEFRDALDYWIAHSRRVGGRKRRLNRVTDPIGSSPGTGEVKKIREWAVEEGYEMSSRGRIRAEIVQAFHDAH